MYIRQEQIPIVPLYYAAMRPVVRRGSNWILVDDDRMRLEPGEKPQMKMIRFRTLGCYPLSGGVESDAVTLDQIIEETLSAAESERTSRVIDKDGGSASMEKRKKEGYF
jgi:sulfate adenylyltransferase subunit 2